MNHCHGAQALGPSVEHGPGHGAAGHGAVVWAASLCCPALAPRRADIGVAEAESAKMKKSPRLFSILQPEAHVCESHNGRDQGSHGRRLFGLLLGRGMRRL